MNEAPLELEWNTIRSREAEWSDYEPARGVDMVHGFSLHLNPSCEYSRKLFVFRRQEISLVCALARFDLRNKETGEAGTVLDIGANIGYMANVFASRSDVGTIFAYEPSAETFEILEKNSGSRIRPVNAAVGLGGETVEIVRSSDSSAQNAVRLSEEGGVAMVELGSIMRSLSNVTCIKIDTEGFEPAVLRSGFEEILEKRPVIIAEYNSDALEANQGSDESSEEAGEYREILGELQRSDFVIMKNDEFGFLVDVDLDELQGWVGDLFFVPSETEYRL